MRKRTILQNGEHRGFKKGISHVRVGDIAEVRKVLHTLIGGTQCKLQYYINGKTIIREDLADDLVSVFTRYGVQKEEIFDE